MLENINRLAFLLSRINENTIKHCYNVAENTMPAKIEKPKSAPPAPPVEEPIPEEAPIKEEVVVSTGEEEAHVVDPAPVPVAEETPPKKKRTATEAQIAALELGRQRRREALEKKKEEERAQRKRERDQVREERREIAKAREAEKQRIRREERAAREEEMERYARHQAEKRRRQEMADRKQRVREEVRRTYKPLSLKPPRKYMEPQYDDEDSDSVTLGSQDTSDDSVDPAPPRKRSFRDPQYTPPPSPPGSPSPRYKSQKSTRLGYLSPRPSSRTLNNNYQLRFLD